MILQQWATRHGIPPEALDDLIRTLVTYPEPEAKPGSSEAAIQSQVRLEASRTGSRLWRNNSGVAERDGKPIRFGLCNDSAKLNRSIKSADLIGIRPVIITPDHIGHTLGQFLARECKRAGWKYTGTQRETAQLRFLNIVNALGGDGRFVTGDN